MFQGGPILLRTRKTRHARGALVLVNALVLSLSLGALTTTARADDQGPSGTTAATDSSSPSPAPVDGATASTESSGGAAGGLVAAVVASNPTPRPDTLVL